MLFRHLLRRALAVAIVLLAATTLASGTALARTTASIGDGVVVIRTTLGYQRAAAAGTGMVLTSSGTVLTNNHVIRGATRITVVVPGTSRSYAATVAGYSVADDVAVLRIADASNLATVKTSAASDLDVGDPVTAIGNGGGTGTLHSVTGEITTLRRSIIVRDETRGAARLTGLIGATADVEPGDSGGPLINSANAVIGMNTAGSTGYASRSATLAYAIPIGRALSIVQKIDAGRGSARIHIGATPFLGIQVASYSRNGDFASPGAVVTSVIRGGPAANAGVSPGDVITAIDGRAISSSSSITAALLTKKPGAKVTLRLTDRSGDARSATVTLASGPAQ